MSLYLPASLDPTTKRPPAERFADAQEVRELCDTMRHADNKRGENRAKIQGLIDGNRPYSQADLRAQSQGWRANVNYREAEGIIQAQRTPYYDLVTEVNPCIQVVIDYGPPNKRQEWQDIIEQEFHRTLFGWDSLDWHIQLRQSEELVHGWGAHLTLDKYDWRPETKVMRDVLFPDGTRSKLDDLEFFCVRDTVKAHELYGAIRDKEIARKVGWNVSAVEDAIIEAATTKMGHDGRQITAETVQQRLKNGDMGFGYNGATALTLDHMFVREYGTSKRPGGITHYIVNETTGAVTEYLYKKRNRFNEFNEILHFFPFDIGSDGTLHSIRGLGARIFPFCELYNRLKNHMVDNVLINSGILLTQTGTGVDMQRLMLTVLGPLKILPAGLTPAQWQPMQLNQGPIPLTRELQQTMQENTKTYRQTMADTQQERTATEVAINNADTAKLAKSAHNMEYRSLGKMYREQLRRLSNPNVTTAHRGGKEAVAFQERCYRRGVPKAAFAHVVEVVATRSIGAGSATQRIQVAQALLQLIYPMTGPQEQNNILRDYVAALAGQNAPDRYVPRIDSNSIPTDDDSVAVLENDVLVRGGDALVAANQNHVRHGARHLAKDMELIQGLMQGQGDAEMVLGAIDRIGPHTAQHLAYLAKDPTQKTEFEALRGKLTEVSKIADKLRQNIEAQAEKQATEEALMLAEGGGAQPNGNGLDPAMELEGARVMGELQLKAKDQEENRRLKAGALQHKQALAASKQAAELALKKDANEAKSRAYTRPGSKGTPKKE